ncbi:MAG: hypothetical protein D6788_00020 [Planctomycetota bacterium]|nr:MAG: hypothetical protein D6788_00020 [Planctomycetota bacterium]
MARILYAASGDGYGHATRAHAVADELIRRGHDMMFLTSHKTLRYLEPIFPRRVHDVFGLLTVYEDGAAHIRKTLLHNLRRAPRRLGPSNARVRRLFRTFRPDLLVTDFEPFSAFWARVLGVPFVSLDNQHLLTHCVLDPVPGAVWDRLNAYLTIRLYYGGAQRYLVTTFIDAPVRYHPTTLIPPILRPQLHRRTPTSGDYLLVYKGASGLHPELEETLRRLDRMEIRAYGFPRTGRQGHVTYKAIDREAFLDDLAGCAGVIATAGHSLVCECIHLEKPMLLTPIRKQYEQMINAHYVQKLGYGRAIPRLTPEEVDRFLDELPRYRSAMAGLRFSGAARAADVIEAELRGSSTRRTPIPPDPSQARSAPSPPAFPHTGERDESIRLASGVGS